MDPAIIIGSIVLVPVLLLTILRVNAVLVFLSLCLGNVLVQFFAKDAGSFTDMFSAQSGRAVNIDNPTMMLIILLLPAVLTALFMVHTVRGSLAVIINLVPAVGVGLLLALLSVPLLPSGLGSELTASGLWAEAEQAQDLIVGISALSALFVLWLQRPRKSHSKHGKHKH